MRKFLLLFILFFSLTACTNDEDLQKSNKNQENKKQIGIVETGSSDGSGESEDDFITEDYPPGLMLESGSTMIKSELNKFCWNETNCLLKPDDPKMVMELYTIRSVSPDKKYKLSLYAEEPYIVPLRVPDDFDVTIIDRNGNESKLEVINRYITTPAEKGEYFMNVYAKWHKEVQGEAIYTFKIYVH